MSRQQWIVWSWDDRHATWMEVFQGTEKDATATLERKQSAAAKHMPSARFTMTPKNQPPQEPPDELGESHLSGMRAQDRPGWDDLVRETSRGGRQAPPAKPAEFDVRVQWHSPDAAFAAVFLRDGKPWFLNGALVGMGGTREAAITDLTGIARHLVIHGENFLTAAPLLLADREWLFKVLDQGPSDDEMYAAIAKYMPREAG